MNLHSNRLHDPEKDWLKFFLKLAKMLKTGIIQVPLRDWLSIFIEHVMGNINRRSRVKVLKIIPALIKLQTKSCSNSTIQTIIFFSKLTFNAWEWNRTVILSSWLWTLKNVTFFYLVNISPAITTGNQKQFI